MKKKYSDDIEKIVTSYEYKISLIKFELEKSGIKLKQLSSPKRLIDYSSQIENESEIIISKELFYTLKNYENNYSDINKKFELFINRFREFDLLTMQEESKTFFECLENIIFGYKELKEKSIPLKNEKSPSENTSDEDEHVNMEDETIEEKNQYLKPKRGKVYGIEGPFPFFGVKYQFKKIYILEALKTENIMD